MGDAHLFGITRGIQCLKASPPLPLHKMTMASIKNYEFFQNPPIPRTNTFGFQIAQGNSQQNLLISYQNPNLDPNTPLTNRN